jgi:surface protein
MALPSIISRPEKIINGYTSKWNAGGGNLPLLYQIENDKFPTNTESTAYNWINLFSDSGKLGILSGSGTIALFPLDGYVQISSANYSGIFRIIRKTSVTIVLDTNFTVNEAGTFRQAYINYKTEIDVYAGVPTGHPLWVYSDDAIAYIGTLAVVPNTNNISYADIKDYVQTKLSSFNNQGFVNDTGLWTGFYIIVRESYDTGYGTRVTSSNVDDSANTLFAAYAALPFGYPFGGNMFEYTNDSSKPEAKWLVNNPSVLFEGTSFYDVSAIINVDTFDVYVEQYDDNGSLLDMLVINYSGDGYGLYRFDLSQVELDADVSYLNVYIEISSVVVSDTLKIYVDKTLCIVVVPAPIGFAVTASAPEQLSLSWSDPTGGVGVFQIQKSLDGVNYTPLITTAAGATSYTDTGLDDNTQYFYRIRSSLGGATSAWVLANATTFSPFVLTVKTDNTGASNTDQFEFNIGNTTPNHKVWYNGVNIHNITNTSEGVITFPDGAGTKEIKLTGSTPFEHAFANTGDRQKVIDIKRWGINLIITNAYWGCINMTVTATDLPIYFKDSCTSAFRNCTSLTTIPNINLWDVSSVTDFRSMFETCFSLTGDFSTWDISSATGTGIERMFYRCNVLDFDPSGWDISGVTSLSDLFFDCFAMNPNVVSWDVAHITNINRLFYRTLFNRDISSWNTANVTEMAGVFFGTPFNQDISGWNTANATLMSGLFENNTSFNQNISSWNTANVTRMDRMFSGATSFNQDIGGWNTGNVQQMQLMFSGATSFNQDISSWNTANVTRMDQMFNNASAFNQDIGGWNTEKVNNMLQMFSGATAFNQDLGAWDVISRTGRTTINMSSMLALCGMNTANYDSTLVGWEAQAPVTGVTLGAGGRTYTTGGAGETARTSLISTYSWTITDAGGV